ncbi:hypothetical protein ACF3NG_01380 [Aerococcaceae bacterium WGS1372]
MNHLEDLVDEVTKRVMLAIKENSVTALSSVEKPTPKYTYSLIGKERSKVESYFKHHDYGRSTNNDKQSDVLVISEINMYSIPRIANIIPINAQEELILDYVQQGKTVYLLSDSIQGMNNNTGDQFNKKYNQHVNDLKKMGIRVVNESFFSIENELNSRTGEHGTKKKLITLDYIQSFSLNRNDTFELDKNVIITPLAMDYLKDLNIQVKRRGIG